MNTISTLWICPDCGMANANEPEAEKVTCEVCGHRFYFWEVRMMPADVNQIVPIWSKAE